MSCHHPAFFLAGTLQATNTKLPGNLACFSTRCSNKVLIRWCPCRVCDELLGTFNSSCHTLQALVAPGLPSLDYCRNCSEVRQRIGHICVAYLVLLIDKLIIWVIHKVSQNHITAISKWQQPSEQVQLVHTCPQEIKRNKHFVNHIMCHLNFIRHINTSIGESLYI